MAVSKNVLGLLKENQTTVIITAMGLTMAVLFWRSTRKKYHRPPGPRGLPVLGNILELSKEPLVFKLFVDMAKKYGPIFRVQIGMVETVVLNSSESIRDSFLKQQNEFAGRPSFYSTKLFPMVFEKSMFLGDFTPAWAIQRKIAHAAIRKYASGKHLEELIHYSMDNVADLIIKEKEAFDPKYIISLLVYNVIAVMCFGKRFELDDPAFTEIIDVNERGSEAFGNGLAPDFLPFLGPLYDIIPFGFKAVLKEFDQKFTKLCTDALDEHEENYDPDNITDLTYHILHDMKALEKDESQKTAAAQIERGHLVNILSDMFFAGTDTSRFTLMWVIQYVAANPHVQDKLHQEIDEIVGQSQPVLMAHRVQLPYCEAVLQEAIRMRPIVPLAVPHKTMCDTTVGGYDIPAGTQVLPNIWALHMDPEKWDKPEEFRPERFLDNKGQPLPKVENYMPFSIGRRVCVGEALAKTELHMLVAMLFQRFLFFPGPGEKLEGEMMDIGLNCFPKSFKIIAKPRI